MKILWITNILFPEAEQLLAGNGDLKSSGGWMLGAADALHHKEDIKLIVACVSNRVSTLTKLEGKKITYYVLPMGKGNQKVNLAYVPLWKNVEQEVQPDVIHIHGTEFSHAHACMKACNCQHIVISIQGLTSVCYYYYYYGMAQWDVYKNLTLRDLIKGTVIHEQKQFKKRGEYEKEMLRMAKHIIGRTSWDRARVWAINPDAQYYFCNEILRPEFYDGSSWNYAHCNKHSIFLSQAHYPIKGLHQVIKAMPFILWHYPDTIIRIAGRNITCCETFSQRIRFSGYGSYIKRLINKLNLQNKVFFIGNLNAEEIKQEYLRSNVFICPSSIENSPNSLGEAQILGVPCLASYVGGIADMMRGNENNLYRFEEVEVLAEKVCNVFAAEEKQIDMKAIAAERHDRKANSDTLYNIYKQVAG